VVLRQPSEVLRNSTGNRPDVRLPHAAHATRGMMSIGDCHSWTSKSMDSANRPAGLRTLRPRAARGNKNGSMHPGMRGKSTVPSCRCFRLSDRTCPPETGDRSSARLSRRIYAECYGYIRTSFTELTFYDLYKRHASPIRPIPAHIAGASLHSSHKHLHRASRHTAAMGREALALPRWVQH
jgi:hypothetical protein